MANTSEYLCICTTSNSSILPLLSLLYTDNTILPQNKIQTLTLQSCNLLSMETNSQSSKFKVNPNNELRKVTQQTYKQKKTLIKCMKIPLQKG